FERRKDRFHGRAVPDDDRAVRAGRGEAFSIRTENRDAGDKTMANNGPREFASSDIPQFDVAVRAAPGQEPLAVVAQCEPAQALMLEKSAHLSGVRIPNARAIAVVGRRENGAIIFDE